jgi:hypothetical protein
VLKKSFFGQFVCRFSLSNDKGTNKRANKQSSERERLLYLFSVRVGLFYEAVA